MFRFIRNISIRAYYHRQLSTQFRESYWNESTPVSALFTAALDATNAKFNRVRRGELERIIAHMA
jgi:hypothetical protein